MSNTENNHNVASRTADELMQQYIKELVEGVFSEVRPNLDLVDEDLSEQQDRVLARDPAIETGIKQRISDLYDETEERKEELYYQTLYEICQETYTTY